jgi:hypothetical protein
MQAGRMDDAEFLMDQYEIARSAAPPAMGRLPYAPQEWERPGLTAERRELEIQSRVGEVLAPRLDVQPGEEARTTDTIRRDLEREIEQDLAHVAWAPRVNISARTGRHMEKLVPALELALRSWDTRIATGKFNAFLSELTAAHPHPVRGGKQPRILFGTQPRRGHPPSCFSPPDSSIPGTVDTSPVACARSTALKVRPCR